MGPKEIKKDIYHVMTNSRELTNYCQESVKPVHSKKISEAINTIDFKPSIEFISQILTNKDKYNLYSSTINFNNSNESNKKAIYSKVMDYIESYLPNLNLNN